MKYLIVLGDGMADRPGSELGNKTPLEVASIPNMDMLASKGELGRVKTIPNGMKPGSDIANLSVLGFNPAKYYTGRSPLEALAIGVNLRDTDVAIRTNLVTLSSDEPFEKKSMIDYSAGEITTKESQEIMKTIQKELGSDEYTFYAGVSYRHCLVSAKNGLQTVFCPPHDITGEVIEKKLPSGVGCNDFINLINESGKILKDHPVNKRRERAGLNQATHLWFWGAGTKPNLPSFYDKYGLKGGVVSAVDLLKGIGVGTGMLTPNVIGATGTVYTNWDGKIEAAKKLFENGTDFVFIHLEAPDEAGHQGNASLKIAAIERVDYVVGEMYKYLQGLNEPFKMAVLPDHATPLILKTHSSEAVPYIIYNSEKERKKISKYTEREALNGKMLQSGEKFMERFLRTN
ncbi:MAG TPA: cofactor-independent phosphoglycerate mutase [Clostridia bacterium]|nr:cofactor-independent phosphoglycerate mutase [Clostridia bacterium]